MLLAKLKRLSILILIATISLGISDCGSAPKLGWHGKPWVGNSDQAAIVRKENGEPVVMSCSEPEFHGYVCISGDDFVDLQEKYKAQLLKCERWSPK